MRTGIGWFANRRAVALCLLIVMVPLLSACNTGGSGGDAWKNDEGWVSWNPTPQAPVAPAIVSSPVAVGGSSAKLGVATPASGGKRLPLDFARILTDSERKKFQPDEMGLVPIPMYHAFVKDTETKGGATTAGGDGLDQWTRTISEFRADLQWYYDHDFFVIPMRDYVENAMNVPAGKHPLVLTFDDASTRQAMWIKNSSGTIMADPESALGVMEAFSAEHPDFGRGGYFAVLLYNCFNNPDGPAEMADCATKLNWMADHGYEIGNHTQGHQDLTDISDDDFRYQIGDPTLWIRAHVPAKADMSSVLTLPFGAYPKRDLHPTQWEYLVDGFSYQGEAINLEGILQVNGGPAMSPVNAKWDRYGIARFNTDPEVTNYWWSEIESGELTMYTSDGNPDIVTVPNALPSTIAGLFDADRMTAKGYTVIQYDPATGSVSAPKSAFSRWSLTAILEQPVSIPDRLQAAGW